MAPATTSTLPVSLPREREGRRDRARWRTKRRGWLDLVRSAHQLTSGAVRVALLLAGRSDDTAKPVWGTQVNMGTELALSERTVRRCLGELEALGLIRVDRHPAWRDTSGLFWHRPCNTYHLTMPARAALRAAEPPRRVPKLGYCPVKPQPSPTGQQRPLIPLAGMGDPLPIPAESLSADENGEIIPSTTADSFERGLAMCRAALVRSPVARQAPPP